MTPPSENTSELQRLRQSEGLSRAQLAREAGVSDRTIKRGEDGAKLRTETRYRIVRGLNSLSEHEPPYEIDDVFPEASHV
jgi:transcriptional regulator with XRE-family HTH domain